MAPQYDFVIIGGGTSGLVLANRMSENPQIQVLVLEDGENLIDEPNVKFPGNAGRTFGTSADWAFKTKPQPELEGRQIDLTQGKALGGSSALNLMMYVPPSRTIIDAWEQFGNKGWGWDDLKPYFAKAYSVERLPESLKQRLGIIWPDKNTSGPIQTSLYHTPEAPVIKAWDETLARLSLRMNTDPFSGPGSGGYAAMMSIEPTTGERSYSATAYYASAANRPNLHLITGCQVEKIIFERQGSENVATGVQISQNGKGITIDAHKELILAAGSIQSPKILELSGIGNKALLESHSIEVIVDNPYVGENLQDHLLNRMTIADEDPGDESSLNNDPTPIDAAMTYYTKQNPGPSTIDGTPSIAYLPLPSTSTLSSLFSIYPFQSSSSFPLASQYYEIARSCIEKESEASAFYVLGILKTIAPEPKSSYSINISLSQPLSRGSVHISSSNPNDHPTIDPKYLSHPLDLEIAARHLQFLSKLLASKETPINQCITQINDKSGKYTPGFLFEDLGVAKEFVKRTGTTMWHPTSTCSMLPREKGGVVDERLRVYGVRGVRVVDASVMPLITRGNPQATVYAVAEKAADLVQGDWGC